MRYNGVILSLTKSL